MGLFGFGKGGESLLIVVTSEGAGRLRINGLRIKGGGAKKSATAHAATVCWIEFSKAGKVLDQGIGSAGGGRDRLLRDLPANPICQGVLDRLREGQESVGKWLQLNEPASR
jgi:hypothetical protein